MAGRVAGIYLSMSTGAPMRRVPAVEAVAGSGLRGDRYFTEDPDGDPTEEITLFAREDVDAAVTDSGLAITPGDMRRNIMTEAVDLGDAVGGRLRIGEVVVASLEDNPPCARLQRLAGRAILEPLVGRGGLRGRIVAGGTIRDGDAVEPVGDGSP